MFLGQATIAALETANLSDARERGADSTKNHEPRPGSGVFAAIGIVTWSLLASALVQFSCQVLRTVKFIAREVARNFLPEPFCVL